MTLKLKKETLRVLSHDDLRGVVGGIGTYSVGPAYDPHRDQPMPHEPGSARSPDHDDSLSSVLKLPAWR